MRNIDVVKHKATDLHVICSHCGKHFEPTYWKLCDVCMEEVQDY